MNSPTAFPAGEIRPHSYALSVAFEGHELVAEAYGLQGQRLGLDNPDGVVAIMPNGVGEGRSTNRLAAGALSNLALEHGVDMTVISYDDGNYYRQASYTAAMVAVGSAIRQETKGPMLWVPHSRGGNSVVDGRRELAAMGAMGGVFGRATPYAPLGFRPDVFKFMREAQSAFMSVHSMESYGVYSAMIYNFCAQAIRPDLMVSMLYEVATADNRQGWNELSAYAGIPVVLAQYSDDGIVAARPNLAAMSAESEHGHFLGRALLLPGNHATGILDPSDARHVLAALIPDRLEAAA
jgi:hypothetical protein